MHHPSNKMKRLPTSLTYASLRALVGARACFKPTYNIQRHELPLSSCDMFAAQHRSMDDNWQGEHVLPSGQTCYNMMDCMLS